MIYTQRSSGRDKTQNQKAISKGFVNSGVALRKIILGK